MYVIVPSAAMVRDREIGAGQGQPDSRTKNVTKNVTKNDLCYL